MLKSTRCRLVVQVYTAISYTSEKDYVNLKRTMSDWVKVWKLLLRLIVVSSFNSILPSICTHNACIL